MPIRSTILLFAIACGVAAPVLAGFTVDSWMLVSGVIDSSSSSTVTDFDLIENVVNPLTTDAIAQIGSNYATATYDHSWIESLAWGDFNTSFTHQIRTPELKNISTSAIYIQSTEPLRVTIDSLFDYAQTPGDLDSFLFTVSIRNETTLENEFFDQTVTGVLHFDPPTGTVHINDEVTLQPGTTYRLRYGLQSDNISDDLPTGTMDASGYVNFSIRPVPEPGVVFLIGPMVLVFGRKLRSHYAVRR